MRAPAKLLRNEPWGQILYNPVLDEFEGLVRNGTNSFLIDHPLSAGCLITRRCNLKCGFCYGNFEALPEKELSSDTWSSVFKTLASWGIMRVDISGGEPAIRPDLPAILESALSNGLHTILSTNGMLLDDLKLSSLPTDVRIHVSIDSGFEAVHAHSRLRHDGRDSRGSLAAALGLLRRAMLKGHDVRVLTCVGPHNRDGLVELGERIATLGITEWNVSRILRAGRAQAEYERRWAIDDDAVLEQVQTMRSAFPWMHIKYSNRTNQDGYFLLVLPDGTIATQYTDGRDKTPLGKYDRLSVEFLRTHTDFNLLDHGRKWLHSIRPLEETFDVSELYEVPRVHPPRLRTP